MAEVVKRAHSTSPPPALEPKRTKLETAPNEPIKPDSIPQNIMPSLNPAAATTKPAQKQQKKQRKGAAKPPKAGGAEEISHFDLIKYLGLERLEEMQAAEKAKTIDWRKEADSVWTKDSPDVDVKIVGLNSHGDGLAILTPPNTLLPTRLLTIPFALPSELVTVHIHRHEPLTFISHADLIKIVERSPLRDYAEGEPRLEVKRLGEEGSVSDELRAVREKFGERVQCQYFGKCSGCQYQPLAYDQQLLIKQTVVANAFLNFSLLPPSAIPTISPTLLSPLEYGYRTKLTPHFQSPPDLSKPRQPRKFKRGKERAKEEMVVEEEGDKKEWELTIGFEEKGRKRVIDIEECVLATPIINTTLTAERARVAATISQFKRGSTLLLRDSLPPRPAGSVRQADEPCPSTEAHVCITDHHETVREQVGKIEFEQMAGSFFQNNNSILPSLMEYISTILQQSALLATGSEEKMETREKRYLIDAYCGSGLFSIALADQFDEIEGVEIDKASVKWAKKNAEFNKAEGRGVVGFRAGNAEAIFDSIKFPPHLTTILIDPPRKGCDIKFLDQLLAFNPEKIIYISCNVHTQARDVGHIIRESNRIDGVEELEGSGSGSGKGFWIESLRAADLFAQTHHAEGVAVLRRKV